jgi:hypothetical protein
MAINCIHQQRLHVNEDLVIIEQHKTGTYLTGLWPKVQKSIRRFQLK